MDFEQLQLIEPIRRALSEQGYTQPTAIQAGAIPPALEGRDVLGSARTGTGKTCAFAVPILQRLTQHPVTGKQGKPPIRALVLTPTRELAIQNQEQVEHYGKYLPLKSVVIYGGVGQKPQVDAIQAGAEILIATPGRLADLYGQGLLDLSQLEIFVLDEADRMLDMGFIHDVRKILKWLPEKKQTLFFSATMPDEIMDLVNRLLDHPARVAVDPVSSPVEVIQQSAWPVDRENKTKLMVWILEQKQISSALVFTRTKHGADKVSRDLNRAGVSAAAIHGNKSQTARQTALANFKSGKIRVLVATDIAARGLDIEELSHVFNYNLPEVPETYVHRIGRTGRAGRGGEAIAFCDFSEKPLLREIEKLTHRSIPVVEEHPWPMQVFELPKKDKNGRTINEEDAEARAAARELRREREAARQAAAQEKQEKSAQASAPSPEATVEGGEKKKRRRRRSKSKGEAPAAPAESPLPAQAPARPKLTRPGTRLETGSAMPCTEFDRPDPLAGDRIMDATARLLAPRRLTLSPVSSREEHGRPRKRSAGQAAQPRQKSEGQKGRSAHTAPQAESRKPAPSKHKKSSQGRGQDRRRSFQDPPRPTGHPKDSTEQESLMKPYYLDI